MNKTTGNLTLTMDYRPPNIRNLRLHWRQLVKEKHKAQDALMSALRSAVADYSTGTPNTEFLKICSTGLSLLNSYRETGRIKSRASATKLKSNPERKKKQ